MIEIQKAELLDGSITNLTILSEEEMTIDASGLVLIPALIDPHVHFRVPGLAHKETWHTAARAALKGGITTVFDMPNTLPACITAASVQEKKNLIDVQLNEALLSLHYHLYLGADKNHFEEIGKAKKDVIALKVFMGSSTGNLVMDDESSLHAAFSLAASHDMVLAVHAEDEALIAQRTKEMTGCSPHMHSLIRNPEVAAKAVAKAIELAKLYKTRLYLLHISSKEELDLIRQAKQEGLEIYAETTPHHLLLSEEDYAEWGTKVQVNPPLRTSDNHDALFKAIEDGIIDTIGSDHAPHTLEEKNQPYGKAPSGIPSIELMLPLLLNTGKLSLQQIVRLMRTRIQEIFRLKPNDDYILIDREKVQRVEDMDIYSKCGWSPYAGRVLKGWPVITLMQGKIYDFR